MLRAFFVLSLSAALLCECQECENIEGVWTDASTVERKRMHVIVQRNCDVAWDQLIGTVSGQTVQWDGVKSCGAVGVTDTRRVREAIPQRVGGLREATTSAGRQLEDGDRAVERRTQVDGSDSEIGSSVVVEFNSMTVPGCGNLSRISSELPGVHRYIGQESDQSLSSSCQDDPDFHDIFGFSCEDWLDIQTCDGRRPYWASAVMMVWKRCPRACGLCGEEGSAGLTSSSRIDVRAGTFRDPSETESEVDDAPWDWPQMVLVALWSYTVAALCLVMVLRAHLLAACAAAGPLLRKSWTALRQPTVSGPFRDVPALRAKRRTILAHQRWCLAMFFLPLVVAVRVTPRFASYFGDSPYTCGNAWANLVADFAGVLCTVGFCAFSKKEGGIIVLGIYLLHMAWSFASAVFQGEHYLLEETRPYVEVFTRVCVGLCSGFWLATAINVLHSLGVLGLYICYLGNERWGVVALVECARHVELNYSDRFSAVFSAVNWLLLTGPRSIWGFSAVQAEDFSTILRRMEQDMMNPPEHTALAFTLTEVCVLIASTLILFSADWLMTRLLTGQLSSKSSQEIEAALVMISGQLCDCFVELTADYVIRAPCPRLSSLLLIQDQQHLMGREFFSFASAHTDVGQVAALMMQCSGDGSLPALCNMFFVGLKDTLGSPVRMQVYCVRYMSVNDEIRFILAMTEVVGQEKEDGPQLDFPSMDSAGSLESGGSLPFVSEDAEADDDISPKATTLWNKAEPEGVASSYPDDPPPDSRFSFHVTVIAPHIVTNLKPDLPGEIVGLEMLLFAIESEKFTRWLRLVCASAALPTTAEFGPAILTPLAKSFGAMWLRVNFPMCKEDEENDFAGYTVHVEAVHCPFPWHHTGAAQQAQGALASLLSRGASSSGALADYASSTSSKSSKRKKRRHRSSSEMRPFHGTKAQVQAQAMFGPMHPTTASVVGLQSTSDDSDVDSFKV